jgi:hypothetical protein
MLEQPRIRVSQPQETPVKYQALSLAVDATQIQIDFTPAGSWRLKRLLLQRRALLRLAGCPRMTFDGGAR